MKHTSRRLLSLLLILCLFTAFCPPQRLLWNCRRSPVI